MEIEEVSSLSRGASFFRGDLHIHSYSASHDVTDTNAVPAEIVRVAKNESLDLIALTDWL